MRPVHSARGRPGSNQLLKRCMCGCFIVATFSIACLTRSDSMSLLRSRLAIRDALVVPELRQAMLNDLIWVLRGVGLENRARPRAVRRTFVSNGTLDGTKTVVRKGVLVDMEFSNL